MGGAPIIAASTGAFVVGNAVRNLADMRQKSFESHEVSHTPAKESDLATTVPGDPSCLRKAGTVPYKADGAGKAVPATPVPASRGEAVESEGLNRKSNGVPQEPSHTLVDSPSMIIVDSQPVPLASGDVGPGDGESQKADGKGAVKADDIPLGYSPSSRKTSSTKSGSSSEKYDRFYHQLLVFQWG